MKLKQYIKIYGISFLFATFILMTYTFVLAYSSESKTVEVDINSIGEANFEMFVLIPIISIFGTLAFIYTIKDEKEEKLKCQKY